MKKYFNIHSSDFIYVGIVIAGVILLYILTNLFHKWTLKKRRKKFSDLDSTTINLVKRVLNALWIVFGLIALSFVL
ncbi:hypothetical protein [Maribacter sp. ACAM166]|uniref:hypothetical protein n=1 Tax=Maribacter sp. ACAM166 TaxID=2508996 RepID=UPI0010FE3D69|nr:hypothetical protein [Maribacter sp. ACAM166]TLP74272.1 hypothetical protein ES765_16395 [Maribacter sp. ACAM166]